MGSILISYRREDSAPWAGRIYERLARDFTQEQLFIDVVQIEPGLDFVKELDRQVAQCEVLLAVIGRDWLASRANGTRRVDNLDDLVRIEIESALQRDIRVIPVLVDGASMPRREELPESLQPLVRRQAVELTHAHFATDIQRLVAVLQRALDSAALVATTHSKVPRVADVWSTLRYRCVALRAESPMVALGALGGCVGLVSGLTFTFVLPNSFEWVWLQFATLMGLPFGALLAFAAIHWAGALPGRAFLLLPWTFIAACAGVYLEVYLVVYLSLPVPVEVAFPAGGTVGAVLAQLGMSLFAPVLRRHGHLLAAGATGGIAGGLSRVLVWSGLTLTGWWPVFPIVYALIGACIGSGLRRKPAAASGSAAGLTN